MDLNSHIRRQIKMNRKQLGLTQTDVADIAGITFGHYAKFEKGVEGYNISLNNLHLICEALGCKVTIVWI